MQYFTPEMVYFRGFVIRPDAIFSMGFIPALKIEASGGSQARKRKARRGKYARGVLDCLNSMLVIVSREEYLRM